jgi:hypothetical protein
MASMLAKKKVGNGVRGSVAIATDCCNRFKYTDELDLLA